MSQKTLQKESELIKKILRNYPEKERIKIGILLRMVSLDLHLAEEPDSDQETTPRAQGNKVTLRFNHFSVPFDIPEGSHEAIMTLCKEKGWTEVEIISSMEITLTKE